MSYQRKITKGLNNGDIVYRSPLDLWGVVTSPSLNGYFTIYFAGVGLTKGNTRNMVQKKELHEVPLELREYIKEKMLLSDKNRLKKDAIFNLRKFVFEYECEDKIKSIEKSLIYIEFLKELQELKRSEEE